MTLDYDAFLDCTERWSIMSHLIKSRQNGGKKEREEEREDMPSSPLVIGCWVMAIDYSYHRAVTETQYWLNGYTGISSTSSEISPDG